METISVSEINTYLKCARRWYLTYEKNLVKLVEETGPARLGTIVHDALAVAMRYYYDHREDEAHPDIEKVTQLLQWAIKSWDKGNRPIKTLANPFDGSEQRDEAFYKRWDDALETAALVASETVKHVNLPKRYKILDTDSLSAEYRPEGKPVPLIEYRLEWPIPHIDYKFVGVVDLVVEDLQTGHIVAIDWKTKKNFIDYDDEYLNQQLGLYQYVLRQQGLNVTQGVSYQIKSTIHKPEMNASEKNPSMSRRDIVTSWPIYRDALVEKGLDPDNYQDMKAKLAQKELFRPLVVFRSDTHLENLWANVVANVYRMYADVAYPLALGYPCQTCPFNPVCTAVVDGHTDMAAEIIDTQFTSRKVEDVRIDPD